MDHYLDIHLLPDEPEIDVVFILNALFSKLHLRLVQHDHGRIGISFPKKNKHLGDVLRLHGTLDDLTAFMCEDWRKGLKGFTACSEISRVPSSTTNFRVVRRVQAKSAHNKRQRSIAKGWLTEREAFERIPDSQQKTLNFPFVQILSRSTAQKMRVYIEHGPIQAASVNGMFSTYGLSAVATIPWF